MYYGGHGVIGFVGEGRESAFTNFKTSTSFKKAFKTVKHKSFRSFMSFELPT